MNIDSIKRRLLVKYPYFGSVIANTSFHAENGIETAGTDGEKIYYNPLFVEQLGRDEQTFLFAHEICHIAFNHVFRSEGKDHDCWNTATDAVINALLQKDGLSMIAGGVDMPEAIHCNAEEIYYQLIQEKQQKSSEQNQNGSGNPSSEHSPDQTNDQNQKTSDVGHDTHKMWDEAVKKKKAGNEPEQSENGGKTNNDEQSFWDKILGRNKKQNKEEKQTGIKEKKKSVEKLTELGEQEVFQKNKQIRQERLEELRKTLAKEASKPGTTTKEERRNITDIGSARPLIDWRIWLREAAKVDVDWSYQNASIENGVLTPYLEEIPQPEADQLMIYY